MNEAIGWLGSTMFAICGLPQVIKTWRTKKAGDLSSLFLWLWFWGEIFTLIYILYGDISVKQYHYPLYFNYLGNLVMAAYLLYAKYIYTSRHAAVIAK